MIALLALGGASSAFGVSLIVLALASYGVALNLARPLQQRPCRVARTTRSILRQRLNTRSTQSARRRCVVRWREAAWMA